MVYILFKCTLPFHKKKEFHELFQTQSRLLGKHGGKVIGVWDVEMGPCSEFVMIWAAEDLNASEKTLRSIREDPEAKMVMDRYKPMFGNCERWVLQPAPYSPLQ